ncbi:hypothetical protein ACN3XK_49585 [Actinomadura welshii]|uniref:Uncharacterized protein n=1 Tax=Actinomadura livida TaxID=79909 RepID=A0A7W7II40_9ACTN|nr:hypothetical protein [Actinomadura catellatispora]MBB4777385.1 hypothetical protein [Actinomadura catellatispora]
MAEGIMQAGVYEWQSDFARKHIAEGKIEGKLEGEAELLLVVLESRGFKIDDGLRRRITSCQDLDQIHTWARRAVTASSLNDIFA